MGERLRVVARGEHGVIVDARHHELMARVTGAARKQNLTFAGEQRFVEVGGGGKLRDRRSNLRVGEGASHGSEPFRKKLTQHKPGAISDRTQPLLSQPLPRTCAVAGGCIVKRVDYPTVDGKRLASSLVRFTELA